MSLRLVLRVTGVVLAMLLGLEGGTRLDDWVRFDVPLTARPVGVDDLLTRDSTGMHGRPSSHFRKWRMNALGMRGPEPRFGVAVGAPRVLVAGASETFGLLESPGAEWPAQLQARLTDACGPTRPDVLNAAFAGMSLPTVAQDLTRRGAALSPAWFVYYPTPAQYLEVERPAPATPDTSTPAGAPLPAFRWRVTSRLRDQLRDALPAFVRRRYQEQAIADARQGRGAEWLFTSPPADRLAAFDADLRGLVGAARAIGAQVLLVQHATYVDGPPPAGPRDADFRAAWNRYYPRATTDALIAMEGAAAAVVARVAADSAAILVDARAALHADRDRVFGDQSHFTDAGASLVAGQVASTLVSVGACGRSASGATP
jgi:hypothetical protein